MENFCWLAEGLEGIQTARLYHFRYLKDLRVFEAVGPRLYKL